MSSTTTDVKDTPVTTNTTLELKAQRAPRIQMPPFKVIKLDASDDLVVQDIDAKLLEALREATNDIDGLYDDKPQIPVESLFEELPTLQSYITRYGRNAKLTQLIRYLEDAHADQMARVRNMLARGVVSFTALRLLLKPGTEVVIAGDHAQGGRITHSRYRRSMFGSYLEIVYEYVSSNGRSMFNHAAEVTIEGYTGVQSINQLRVRPLTDQDRATLSERGAIYRDVAVGAHYLQFTGQMEVLKWWSYSSMRATGRCMVDIATHNQFKDGRASRDSANSALTVLEDHSLWMADAYVQGFSFVTKQWGRFPVAHLTQIEFKSNAYDQLVLDAQKKDMVRALVQDNSSGFADIISGKGGGCIFLLHGEPGVGKTLTAEAVSELLRRPLYSVSVGELGTDPASLEKNLRQILDVAQIWNAVILIDEADIFLEKRTNGDILRNAMVGIFLRLLEYHQGVMFLTTNRVNEFDSAFHSRISVALRYSALTVEARESIWRNLLAAASVTDLDVVPLAQHEINGRQIKNTIRLAQSLARQEGVPVAAEHIARCMKVSQQFVEDVA